MPKSLLKTLVYRAKNANANTSANEDVAQMFVNQL